MYYVSSAFFIIGAFFLYRQWFPCPNAASNNAVARHKMYGVKERKNKLMDQLGSLLGRFYKPAENRTNHVGRMLSASGNATLPKVYLLRLTAQSLCWSLLGCIMLLRSPLLFLLCIAYAAFSHYLALHDLKEKYQQYQSEVEKDLPKLCSVINARLRSTKNVQAILESFLPIASAAMKGEITLTIADMKTGSAELALHRMETRLASSKVSDVVRGLISVLHGDDQSLYFQAKQHQMNNDCMTIRKKEIQQRSMKMTMPGLLAFLFFFILLIYPLAIRTSQVAGQLF